MTIYIVSAKYRVACSYMYYIAKVNALGHTKIISISGLCNKMQSVFHIQLTILITQPSCLLIAHTCTYINTNVHVRVHT